MKTNTIAKVLQSATALLFTALATACSSDNGGGGGGGGGGAGGGPSGNFTPATPPSDVCALLTLSDVQGLFPGAAPGTEEPTGDTTSAGFWARDCKYDGTPTSMSVELVVFGALTPDGLLGIKAAASAHTINAPVSGLGDEAHFWEDTAHGTKGLWAIEGSYSVDVTMYSSPPFPPEEKFHPLVAKALGQL